MAEIKITVGGLYQGYSVSVEVVGEKDTLLIDKLPNIIKDLRSKGITPSGDITPLSPEDKYKETIYDGTGAKLVCTWNANRNEKSYLVKIAQFQKFGIPVYEEITKFYEALGVKQMEVGQETPLNNYKIKVLMTLSDDKTEYRPYKCIDIKAKQ